MILLMHKDAVGYTVTEDSGRPEIITGGPMAPDYTTLQDAQNTIRNYGLENKLPSKVVHFFENRMKLTKPLKNWRNLPVLSSILCRLFVFAQKRLRRKKESKR